MLLVGVSDKGGSSPQGTCWASKPASSTCRLGLLDKIWYNASLSRFQCNYSRRLSLNHQHWASCPSKARLCTQDLRLGGQCRKSQNSSCKTILAEGRPYHSLTHSLPHKFSQIQPRHRMCPQHQLLDAKGISSVCMSASRLQGSHLQRT